MNNLKPALKDRLWKALNNDIGYGEMCFQLRMNSKFANLWRVNYLIDSLRETKEPNLELEIGLAMLYAYRANQDQVVELMRDKNCGEVSIKGFLSKDGTIDFALREIASNFDLENNRVTIGEVRWKDVILMEAVYTGKIHIVKDFIEEGADLNLLDGILLRTALYQDDIGISHMLIDNNATVSKDAYKSLLMNISMAEREYNKCFDYMLELDIDIKKADIIDIFEFYSGIETNDEVVQRLIRFSEKMTDKVTKEELIDNPVIKSNQYLYNALLPNPKAVAKLSKSELPKKNIRKAF